MTKSVRIMIAVFIIIMLVASFVLITTQHKLTAKVTECNQLIAQHSDDSTEIAKLNRSNDEKLLRITGLFASLDSLSTQHKKSQLVVAKLNRDKKNLETALDSLLAVNRQSQSQIKLLTIQNGNLADSTAVLEKGLLEQNASWQARYDTLSLAYIHVRNWAECEHNRGWLKRLFDASRCPLPTGW